MLTTVQVADGHRIALRITHLNFETDDKSHRNKINYMSGILLIKW
jgi:hypothetical protein